MLSRVQLNIILTHFCLARKLPLPGRWGGARNRPLESAEKIAKAGDEGLVDIEREEVKRKGSDEYDEPPAKRMRVGEEVSMRTGGEDRFSKLVYRHYYCTFFGKVWEATFAIGKYTCMQGWLTHLLYSDDMTNKTIREFWKRCGR